MSIISRYEVRLKCIELATTMSSSQDPLDTIFIKADKISNSLLVKLKIPFQTCKNL